MNHHEQETEKNIAAENAHVRKTLWGSEETPETEEMGSGGNIVLGDVRHPTPIVIAGNQSSGGDLLKTLAIAALGAAVPTAGLIGVAGYHLLNQQQPAPIVQPVLPDPESPDFSVGLGKIEDYLKE